jgi:hypothetical protein
VLHEKPGHVPGFSSFKHNTRNTMKIALSWIAVVLSAFVLLAVLALGGNMLNLWSFQFFAPKYEQARRDTFEQGKAYRDGMAQELRALQIEYIKADDKIKPALSAAIKHKAAGVPDDALPADLALWVRGLP